jgi:precorrin-2 dehydrogenase/sirohydrochlorin ferrochelatase
MLLDLCLAGRSILVIGGGSVAERKVRKFTAESANVTVASHKHTSGLKRLSRLGKVKLLSCDVETDDDVNRLIASNEIVIAATDNQVLNERIASCARDAKALVCIIDNPSWSDLRFPAIVEKGGVQIAVFTGGKSPAMSKLLRRRMERVVTSEDVRLIELMDYARGLVKSRVRNRNKRKRIIYTMIRSKKIASLLRKGSLEKAKILAREIVERERHSRNVCALSP